MFRFAIIFLLTILSISHIQSQTNDTNTTDTLPTNSTESITSFEPITNSTPISEESTTETPSSTDNTTWIDSTTSEPLSSESSAETSEETNTTSVTSTDFTSDTTEPSITPFFYCDFTNSSCFGSDQLTVTDGSEFNPISLSYDTPPPRVPFSDVTSIIELTNNGKICALPYQPYLNNSMETVNWNMSFCYKQHCPTGNGENATCEPGNYGLILVNATETYRTISSSFHSPNILRDSVVEQLLSFYYYFTVFENQPNLGQEIQIWIKPDNQINNQFSLVNLTINDMNGNKWQSRELTFQSSSENYTLEFVFRIDVGVLESNKTIYFALDNIALYNINNPYTSETGTDFDNFTTISTTSTTTAAVTAPPPPSEPGSDLGMIIGLSLGIGIPVLLIVVGGIILYEKKSRTGNNYDIPLRSTHLRKDSDIFDNPLLF